MKSKAATKFVQRGIFAAIVAIGCGRTDPGAGPAEEPVVKGKSFRIAIAENSTVRQAVRQRLNEWEFRTESQVEFIAPDRIDDADLWIGDGVALAQRRNIPPIPEKTLDHISIDYITFPPTYRLKLARRGQETVAFPLTTDQALLWVREDLFGDEEIRKAFREGAGRSLTVPRTWEELVEVAEFFRRHDAVEYGCVEGVGSQAELVRAFFVRSAAYVKGPSWSSFAFDTETGQPRLDVPGFVHGLENLRRSLQTSPAADGELPDEAAARALFRQGDAAMFIGRRSPLIANETSEAVPFETGVARLPGALQVFDPRSERFEPHEEINRCVHLATTGCYVTFGRPPEDPAVELLFRFLADKQESVYLVYAAREGGLPIRPELLNDPTRFAGYGLSTTATNELFRITREALQASNWVADLRLPQSEELLSVLAPRIESVLKGEIEPGIALERSQEVWRQIVADDDDFLARYRESLGLPDLER